jgi:bifunctional non-homologous end joining protein LigD
VLSAFPIQPMLLKSARRVPACGRYRYEFKWDGFRALVFLDRGQLRIQSRNLRDMTADFPELHMLAHYHRRRRLILDGELVALGADGKPDFSLMQERLPHRGGRAPVTFTAFDVLHIDGNDTTREPFSTRRKRLEALRLRGECWQTSQLFDDGNELRSVTRRMALEGIVAKRTDAPYEPGRRSGAWLKLKNTQVDTFTVGGIIPPTKRQGKGWALIVGKRQGERWRYAGTVELGVTGDVLQAIEQQAGGLVTTHSPFGLRLRGAFHLRPALRVNVQYLEWRDGGYLREACCRGMSDVNL